METWPESIKGRGKTENHTSCDTRELRGSRTCPEKTPQQESRVITGSQGPSKRMRHHIWQRELSKTSPRLPQKCLVSAEDNALHNT